jgi:multicomponent K+:H+ antiporter subunit G
MTQNLIDVLTALPLLAGAGFALIGSIAIVRLPDIFTGLHGPTKATTLGVGGVLIASILFFSSRGGLSVHELMVTIFLVITAPVSAYLIANAALHQRYRSVAAIRSDARSYRQLINHREGGP